MGLSLINFAREVWKFGTHERAARGTPLMLFATALGDAAAVRFSTPRLQGAAAGYGVTAAKTLVITRALFRADAAAIAFSMGYSDADLGMSAVADGANPVDLDSPAANGLGALVALVANTMYDVAVYYEVPAGKFPRLVVPVGVANLYVQLFGHEV